VEIEKTMKEDEENTSGLGKPARCYPIANPWIHAYHAARAKGVPVVDAFRNTVEQLLRDDYPEDTYHLN